MTFLLVLLAQTSVVLLGALLAMRLAWRSPAAQVALGRSAIVAILVVAAASPFLRGRVKPIVAIPAASFVAPLPNVGSPKTPLRQTSPKASRPAPSATVLNAAQVTPLQTEPVLPTPTDWSKQITPKRIWLLGAVAGLLWMFTAHLALGRLRNQAKRVVVGPEMAILTELGASHRIRTPDLRTSAKVPSPLLCGILRPTILLPRDLRVEEGALRAVLAHEVSHLVRRDVPWLYVGRIVQSLLWFQPLLWLLRRRLMAASEELSDAEAVRACPRQTYADCLLQIATQRGGMSLAVGMSSSRSRLAARIEAIMDGSRRIVTRLNTRSRILVGGGAAATAIFGGILIAPALAQSAEKGDPKALELWHKTQATYKSLHSISFKVTGRPSIGDSVFWAKIYYQPDRRLAADIFNQAYGGGDGAPLRLVVDGKSVFVFDPQRPKEFLKAPLGKEGAFAQLAKRVHTSPEALSILFGAQQLGLSQLLSKAVFTLGADSSVNGVPTHTLILTATQPISFKWTFAIGVKDGLIRQCAHEWDGGRGHTYGTTETYTALNPNFSDPDPYFRFEVAPGMIERHPQEAVVSSPEVLNKLEEISSAARALKSWSATFDFNQSIKGSSSSSTRKVKFLAPNLSVSELTAEGLTLRTISDGKRIITRSSNDPARYSEQKLATEPYTNTMTFVGTGGYPHPGVGVYPAVEMSYFGIPIIGPGAKLLPSTVYEGEPVDVVEQRSHPTTIIGIPTQGLVVDLIYASKKDHLIRYYRRTTVTPQPEHRPTVTTVETTKVHNLRINPDLPESLFAINLPANAKPFEPSEMRSAAQYAKYEPHQDTLPGNVPPPLTGTLTDGRPFSLSSLRGKVVVLHAWTSGVVVNQNEMDQLIALQRKYGRQGFAVIGVAPYSNPEWVRRESHRMKLPWATLIESPSLQAWKIHHFPFELIIDREGVVRAKNLTTDAKEQMIQRLLAEK